MSEAIKEGCHAKDSVAWCLWAVVPERSCLLFQPSTGRATPAPAELPRPHHGPCSRRAIDAIRLQKSFNNSDRAARAPPYETAGHNQHWLLPFRGGGLWTILSATCDANLRDSNRQHIFVCPPGGRRAVSARASGHHAQSTQSGGRSVQLQRA